MYTYCDHCTQRALADEDQVDNTISNLIESQKKIMRLSIFFSPRIADLGSWAQYNIDPCFLACGICIPIEITDSIYTVVKQTKVLPYLIARIGRCDVDRGKEKRKDSFMKVVSSKREAVSSHSRSTPLEIYVKT
jgi:hypothetical protein